MFAHKRRMRCSSQYSLKCVLALLCEKGKSCTSRHPATVQTWTVWDLGRGQGWHLVKLHKAADIKEQGEVTAATLGIDLSLGKTPVIQNRAAVHQSCDKYRSHKPVLKEDSVSDLMTGNLTVRVAISEAFQDRLSPLSGREKDFGWALHQAWGKPC